MSCLKHKFITILMNAVLYIKQVLGSSYQDKAFTLEIFKVIFVQLAIFLGANFLIKLNW